MPAIDAIIFDLDGTLVDAYPGIHESLNETLSALGLSGVSLADVKRMVGRGVENLIQTATGGRDVHKGIHLFKESYERTHLTGTHILPEVPETLAKLSTSIPMAVASNKPIEFTDGILEHLQIRRFFQLVAGPSAEIPPKPHPAMLQSIMKSFDVTSQKTLYVGDMVMDAETAQMANVKLALIPTGGSALEDLRKIPCDYFLSSFSDLLRISFTTETQRH